MHSNEDRPAPKMSSRRVLTATTVLLLIAVFLLVLSVVRSWRPAGSGRQNGFYVQTDDGVFYAAAGNGLAAASREHIRLFTSSGKCVAQADVKLRDGVCAGSSLVSVYYDMGENTLHALYPDGVYRLAELESGATFADVNETGLITVIMDKDGAGGSLLVMDTDLTPLFRWDSSSAVPVEARTYGEDLLCVNTLDDAGSILRFFRIDQTDELGRLTLPGEVVIDFGFLTDGTVAAVTDSRLLLLREDGVIRSELSWEGSHLNAWSLRGRFAALSTVSGQSGGVLTTLDASGKLLGSTPAPGSVRALHSCGERLLVLFTGEESTLYTSDLEELISFQPEEDVSQVFLLPDGRAFFAGDSGVTQIDFTR